MSRLARVALRLAPVAALAVAATSVDVPLFALSPGPARDVLPLIEVEGAPTYPPSGRLLLTTVEVDRATPLTALTGWLESDVEVVPEDRIIPEGETDEEHRRVSLSQMDESKIAAAAAVLERLTGYPEDHAPGALVQDVVPGTPADGLLFPGDLIVGVDGEPLEDVDALTAAIRAAGARRALELEVRAGGEERSVTVRPVVDEELGRPIIGIVPVAAFPFDISIRSGRIGGPSAGLMWALGLYDLLTPEDLLGDREVAGTGTIGLDGKVGPIGGVRQKVVAAERAGAALFLLPRENLAAAREVAEEVELAPVGTLDEAVRVLQRG